MPIYFFPPKIPGEGYMVLAASLLGFILGSLVIYIICICLNPVADMHEMEWLAISFVGGVILAYMLVGLYMLVQRKRVEKIKVSASTLDGSVESVEEFESEQSLLPGGAM